MRLTTKGRYAVTAMLHMALHGQTGAVRLAEIAQQQDISLSYLEQLFSKLRVAGLVVSARGPGGGYRLAAPPAEITAAAIIDAVNESTDATHCGGEGNCQGGEVCLTHFLWSDLNTVVRGFLDGVTLADLMTRAEVRAVAARQQSSLDTIAVVR